MTFATKFPELSEGQRKQLYGELMELVGGDVHFDEVSCPRWLKPLQGESWEGALRYEQGINATKAELRERIKEYMEVGDD